MRLSYAYLYWLVMVCVWIKIYYSKITFTHYYRFRIHNAQIVGLWCPNYANYNTGSVNVMAVEYHISISVICTRYIIHILQWWQSFKGIDIKLSVHPNTHYMKTTATRYTIFGSEMNKSCPLRSYLLDCSIICSWCEGNGQWGSAENAYIIHQFMQ